MPPACPHNPHLAVALQCAPAFHRGAPALKMVQNVALQRCRLMGLPGKQLAAHPRLGLVSVCSSLRLTVAPSREADQNLNGTPEPRHSSPVWGHARTRSARVHPESPPAHVSVIAIQQNVLCLSPNSSLPLWFLLIAEETIAITCFMNHARLPKGHTTTASPSDQI